MNRVLPAIALIAGLSLAGCSSGGTDSAEAGNESGGDSAAQPAAEEAPQATHLDKDQLKQILESTDVDGTTFKPLDSEAATGSEAMKSLENAEYEPAKCKNLAMAVLNASQASKGTTVAGMSSDNTLTAALMSFADESAAADQLKLMGKVTGTCNDVTVKTQGIEMTMSYEEFDASVAGADDTLGLTISMGTDGQTAFSSDSVTARVGNNVVNTASLASADTETPAKAAEAFVEAVENAG